MTGWAAFWLCLAVFILAEVYITMQGIDTALWQFRTPAEKELQQHLIDKHTCGVTASADHTFSQQTPPKDGKC